MKPTFNVTVKSGKDALGSLRDLAARQALVGWPEETGSRDGEPVTNPELAYIHTYGSPARNIPARPILEPAIKAPGNKAPILEELEAGAKAVLDGNLRNGLLHLNRAGQLAADAARLWFVDARNGWAPNAPATIAAKGSDRPLIDTGELRKALTYVVRGK